ncbi:MAG: hypothetical protein ABFD25_20510 [Clostridiaceae bacterium]
MKQVKESGIYKEIPGIGTWEKFCKSVGMSSKTADEGILRLRVFGQEFLLACQQLKVGYRDLRKLQQLANEGEVIIDQEANVITIGEESIPINEEHADDLQAAIEKIIEDKAEVTKRVEKLEKGLSAAVKEETKSLKAEKDALVKEVKRLKPFDPGEKDFQASVDQMEEVKDATLSTIALISKFIIREDIQNDPVSMGLIEGHMQSLELCLTDLRKRWEEKVNLYGE